VLSLNPLDEYLEELEDGVQEELCLSPPSHNLKQPKEKVMCTNSKEKEQKESMLRKIWREVRGKKKKGTIPHRSISQGGKVKFEPLFPHEKVDVYSLMSLNLPGKNFCASSSTGGNFKLFEPP